MAAKQVSGGAALAAVDRTLAASDACFFLSSVVLVEQLVGVVRPLSVTRWRERVLYRSVKAASHGGKWQGISGAAAIKTTTTT